MVKVSYIIYENGNEVNIQTAVEVENGTDHEAFLAWVIMKAGAVAAAIAASDNDKDYDTLLKFLDIDIGKTKSVLLN